MTTINRRSFFGWMTGAVGAMPGVKVPAAKADGEWFGDWTTNGIDCGHYAIVTVDGIRVECDLAVTGQNGWAYVFVDLPNKMMREIRQGVVRIEWKDPEAALRRRRDKAASTALAGNDISGYVRDRKGRKLVRIYDSEPGMSHMEAQRWLAGVIPSGSLVCGEWHGPAIVSHGGMSRWRFKVTHQSFAPVDECQLIPRYVSDGAGGACSCFEKLQVVGKLVPVARDYDGIIKPIDQLSYAAEYERKALDGIAESLREPDRVSKRLDTMRAGLNG